MHAHEKEEPKQKKKKAMYKLEENKIEMLC
jgi:hypothetical protein